jgi:hypothetical protein
MRALKVFNIVMGVVLVAGFTLVLAVIAARLAHRGPAGQGTAPFAGGSIDFPAGARIEAMTASSDRLVVAVVLPDGTRRLLFIDMATGKGLGTIELHSAR